MIAITRDDAHAAPPLEDAQERGDGVHRLEPGDPLARPLQTCLDRRMRRDHQLRGHVVRPRVLLDEARDADALFGEYLARGGKYARLVIDADPVIRARLDVADRDHSNSIV